MKQIYSARLGACQLVSETPFIITDDYSTRMEEFPSLESARDALERGRRSIGPIRPGVPPELKYGFSDHVFACEDGCWVQKSDLSPN